MIQYKIKTDGKKVIDEYTENKVTLNQVALIIYRLEELKLKLLSKKFKSNFEINEDG